MSPLLPRRRLSQPGVTSGDDGGGDGGGDHHGGDDHGGGDAGHGGEHQDENHLCSVKVDAEEGSAVITDFLAVAVKQTM